MMHEYLIMIGGGRLHRDDYSADGVLAVHAYDIYANTWCVWDLENSPGQRCGAACVLAGDTVIIAGGEIEDFENEPPGEFTGSVVALTMSYTDSLAAEWQELPSMPHAVGDCVGFVIAGIEGRSSDRIYVIGSELKSPSQCMQVLDLATKSWSVCTPPPMDSGGVDTGAVHSCRFFCLSDDGDRVHAYLPDEERWMTCPALPELPMSSWGRRSGSGDFAITASEAGLVVLDRSGGRAALLNVVDGDIISVSILSDEHWEDRISAFAQDHRLDGLEVASLELSPRHGTLLKAWAEHVEEKHHDGQQKVADSADDDEPCEMEHVENVTAALNWLENAGCALLSASRCRSCGRVAPGVHDCSWCAR